MFHISTKRGQWRIKKGLNVATASFYKKRLRMQSTKTLRERKCARHGPGLPKKIWPTIKVEAKYVSTRLGSVRRTWLTKTSIALAYGNVDSPLSVGIMYQCLHDRKTSETKSYQQTSTYISQMFWIYSNMNEIQNEIKSN